jgi:hypothetical protein
MLRDLYAKCHSCYTGYRYAECAKCRGAHTSRVQIYSMLEGERDREKQTNRQTDKRKQICLLDFQKKKIIWVTHNLQFMLPGASAIKLFAAVIVTI